MNRLKNLKTQIAIALTLFSLVACSGSETDRDRRREFVVSLVIPVAVARTIERAENMDLAAQRIIEVAERIGDEVDSGVLVSIDQLKPRMLALAKVDQMKESNRLIANSLINAIAYEFTERVKGGLISPDDMIKLSRVCDLVADSARPFVLEDE